MKNYKAFRPLFAVLAMTAAVAGCASAYHSYSGCCINCKYCTPPPLPYTQYPNCVCHSSVAERYLITEPPTEVNADDIRNGD